MASLSGADFIRGYNERIDSRVNVYTRLPEFSYDYSASLETPLKNMGIRDAFSGAANFSKMTNAKIGIDQVLHKTHIELNKNGTEAAAATAIIMKASAILDPEKPLEKYVYLDRPFVYAIIDKQTGIPLFIGTVDRVGT